MNIHKFHNRDGRRYYTPGHPLGCAYVHDAKGVAYLPIPKNASTSTKKTVESLGFRRVNDGFVAPENFEVFAVIRDPVERWISGLIEYYRRYFSAGVDPWGNTIPPWDQYIEDCVREFRETGEPTVKDEHSVPQRYFVVPSLQPTIFIPMDDKFYSRLTTFMYQVLRVSRQDVPWYHLNTSDEQMKQAFKDRLTPEDVQGLHEFHKTVTLVYEYAVQQKSYVRRNELPGLLL